MKLKTSFFNKGILVNDFKRFSWMGIVYGVLLFFTVPLQIIMKASRKEYFNLDYNPIINLLQFRYDIQPFLILVVPVITAIFLFRYIQVKKSVDLFHVLPLKRERLYNHHIFVGMILLTLPVIVNGFISWILRFVLQLETYYTGIDILKWIGITCMMDMVLFLSSVFIGMITGISVAQGIITYIILFLPVGLSGLMFYNMENFIYGFKWYYDNDFDKLSPITRVFNIMRENRLLSLKEAGVYIILCVILYFLSKILYKNRKLEGASKSIVFKVLQPIFKYGATFCSMLVGGLYFGETQHNIFWALFGYLIGSFLGYLIAEIVIHKSMKVFKNFKGYFIYVAVIAFLLLGMKLDITGYENYVPALEKVEGIYFNDRLHFYYSDDNEEKIGFYFNKDNIENIKKLHEQIIKEKDEKKYKDHEGREIDFVYQLKDGKKVKRTYIIEHKDYEKYLKPIYESTEYKKMHYNILKVSPLEVDKMTIQPIGNTSKRAEITHPDHIKEAIEVLKNETRNETYKQMTDVLEPWANINLLLENDKRVYITWKKNHKVFEEWLEEKGYIEKARILPKDVAYVVVEKGEKEPFILEEKSNVKRLEIYDKEKIEFCLRNYTDRGGKYKERYIIGFYGEDKNSILYGSFSIEDAPDFIKEYFQ